jgi:hypothetical protein
MGRSKRAAWWSLAAAVVGVTSTIAPDALALPPGSAANPGMVVSPMTGTRSSPLTILLTSPDDTCPGDSATDGYRWQTYLVDSSIDPATLTYDAAGPIVPAGAPPGAVAEALVSSVGTTLADLDTDPVTGAIPSIPFVDLSVASGIVASSYHIGVACSLGGETERFWNQTITVDNVTATTFDWAQGTVGPPRPPVTDLAGQPGVESVLLTWTAPAGTAPVGYTVDSTPALPGGPFTASAAATSLLIPGLVDGVVYTFIVTPLHPPPATGSTAVIAAVTGASPQVGTGGIQVLRPAGGLVLTQRCGVYGALPEEPPSVGFGAVPAEPASTDQVGTAPSTDGGISDPVFPEYPYPSQPTYPTHCGVDLGIGRLVTAGPLAGAYFEATGRINQITVVDTRDADRGFSVNGVVSDFVDGSDTFPGSLLGWSPVMTDDSDVNLDGYDQLVVAGAVVPPGAGGGLSLPRSLAAASNGRGLGVAVLDARLKLLIPVTADAGTYTATLTFTTI